jgi:hypothetical protein
VIAGVVAALCAIAIVEMRQSSGVGSSGGPHAGGDLRDDGAAGIDYHACAAGAARSKSVQRLCSSRA